MKHRHDAERGFTALIIELRDTVTGRQAFGAVGPRHALGAARRARGVEHQADIAFVNGGRPGNGHRRPKRSEVTAIDIDGNQRRIAMAVDRFPDGRARRLLESDGDRIGIVEHIGDLLAIGPPVEGRKNQAQHLARPVQRRGLVPVGQYGDEMIARLQTPRLQSAGDRANLGIPVTVVAPRVAVDDRYRRGFAQHMPIKDLAEVHCPLACRIARTICS